MIKSEDLNDLKMWLIDSKNFSTSSASDVISRIRRADRIIEIDMTNINYYLFRLNQDKDFSSLSTSVKSQIRRAVKLLSQFFEAND